MLHFNLFLFLPKAYSIQYCDSLRVTKNKSLIDKKYWRLIIKFFSILKTGNLIFFRNKLDFSRSEKISEINAKY